MPNLAIAGRRRTARIVCLAALGALAATMGIARAQQAPAKPVRIGIFLPLTGPAAAGGAANKLGYEMAISEINAAGGIAGRPIVIVYGDDQGDPTVGVGEIKRLIFQEHVDVVVGTQNSQVELAALPVLTEGKVAAISLAGSSALTPQAGPYHFSLAPSATTLGSAMVQFAAKELKPKNSALIYDDGAAAKSGVEGIKATLAEMKTPITGEQQYKFHPSDVTPQLLSLRRGNPDVLYLFSASQDDIGIILKNAQEIGWNVKIVGSLAVGASGALATRVAGPTAFDNTIAQTFERFTYCASQGVGSPIVSDFIKKVTNLFQEHDRARRLLQHRQRLRHDLHLQDGDREDRRHRRPDDRGLDRAARQRDAGAQRRAAGGRQGQPLPGRGRTG